MFSQGQAANPAPNMFGGGGLFGQPAAPAPAVNPFGAVGGNMFGQPPAQNTLFGTPAQPVGGTMFGQATAAPVANLFAPAAATFGGVGGGNIGTGNPK
jgi:hypothetical protein